MVVQINMDNAIEHPDQVFNAIYRDAPPQEIITKIKNDAHRHEWFSAIGQKPLKDFSTEEQLLLSNVKNRFYTVQDKGQNEIFVFTASSIDSDFMTVTGTVLFRISFEFGQSPVQFFNGYPKITLKRESDKSIQTPSFNLHQYEKPITDSNRLTEEESRLQIISDNFLSMKLANEKYNVLFRL